MLGKVHSFLVLLRLTVAKRKCHQYSSEITSVMLLKSLLVICQWATSLSNNQDWLLAVGPFEFTQIQWCNTINANWSAESKVPVIHFLIQLNSTFKFECLLATHSTTTWRTPVIKALLVWASFYNIVVICTFMQLHSRAMDRRDLKKWCKDNALTLYLAVFPSARGTSLRFGHISNWEKQKRAWKKN